ncbi:MAG: hypothetical protein HYZ21_11770 [Chloroflexi bacterium]|nr:hypothetical protein [Chloroflexota bacterium]
MKQKIRVRLFGAIQIEINGKPTALQRRKAEALLAYLLLHPGPQSREKIASLLWGDSLDDDARRSLRVTLTDIRKVLGDEILTASRDTLSLNPAQEMEVDALTFSQLLGTPETSSIPALASALELYRGDLLEGMYDEWIAHYRENYRRMMLAALGTLTERYRAQGDYSRALDHAERLLTLDPYNEKAVQHVLFSLAAKGDKERATRRFKELQDQGDIEFSRETLALYKNIQQSDSSTASKLTNLPRPLTSFIGREDELSEVETLLTQARLVTLLGAGGSGKTRLSIQAADEIAHQYMGGVWWVDLSPLTEPDLVTQSIAKALGVKEKANQSLLNLTAERIGDQHLLIVLDNCEHLLSACAQSVEYLLTYCPQLTVLATSREPLGVEGEAGWQVPTFPLPEAGLNIKVLKKNESVRLFLERGQSANTSFQLTEANAPQVVNICRKLDGIPLAIELAAALLRSLPVEEVSHRLDQRFEILHISDMSRVPRQKTLHALIDWSYNLLTNTEQIFFRRLGVFTGGWTFDAAVVVGGGYEAENIQKNFNEGGSTSALPINPADIVLGLLNALRRRSLIQVSYTGETSRYSMLETLREYAVERLEESKELAVIHARHLNYMIAFAREADSHLQGKADMVEWGERLKAELDNVRAALNWVMHAGDMNQGMALGAAMYRFWVTRGFGQEGQDWLKRLIYHPHAQVRTHERAYALTGYARALRNTSEIGKAHPLMEEAIGIFTALKNKKDLAYARFAQGDIFCYSGDLEAALPPLQQALAYYREHPKESFIHVNVLSSLGRVALAQKDFPRAYEYIQESSAISEAQGDTSMSAWNKLVLGDIAYSQNDLALARENYEASLTLYRPMNRAANVAYLLEALGSLAFWRSEMDSAIALFNECFQQYDSINNVGTAFSRAYRASIAQMQGDLQAAAEWLQRAASPISNIEDIYRSVYLIKLADFSSAQGDSNTAAVLYLFALRLTNDPITVLFPPDRIHAETELESVRRSMGEADFESAAQRAQTITLEESIGLVFPSL